MSKRSQRCFHLYRAVIVLLVLFVSTQAKGQELLDDILAGNIMVAEFEKTVGTLTAGEQYIFQYDSDSQVTATASVTNLTAASEYPNPQLERRGIVSLWGALFRLKTHDGKTCLALTSENRCSARLLGPLIPPDIFADHNNIVERASAYFEGMADKNINLLDNPRMCPEIGNTDVEIPYAVHRNMGETLFYGAKLLPLIVQRNARRQYQEKLTQVAEILMERVSGIYTSYSECYGDSEFQTNWMTARGLYEYYLVTQDDRARTKIISLWNDSNPLFDRLGKNVLNDPDRLLANVVGQYLHFGQIQYRLNASGLKGWFTKEALRYLLTSQTTHPPEDLCQEDATPYSQNYGSWPHSPTDCDQHLGYHLFSMFAMLDLWDFLKPRQWCEDPYWSWFCTNAPYNGLAGLAWLSSVQRTDGENYGALYDIAPGSTHRTLSNWGTPSGAALYFRGLRLLAPYLHGDIKVDFDGRTLDAAALEDSAYDALDFTLAWGELLPVPEFLEYSLFRLGNQ